MHEISLYEKILESNLINFIIMVWILVIIFKKAHLGYLIQRLADDVRNNVELSAKHVQSALQEYKDARRSSKDTPVLKEKIISDAKENAQNLKEKIEYKTKIETEEIRQNLEKLSSAMGKKIQDSTINELYNNLVELAKDEVQNSLDNDTHKHLIQKSIEQIDNLDGIKL